jgi:hypothetical protein
LREEERDEKGAERKRGVGGEKGGGGVGEGQRRVLPLMMNYVTRGQPIDGFLILMDKNHKGRYIRRLEVILI